MKSLHLNAQVFRFILIGSLVLLIVAASAGFFFAQKILRSYANEASSLSSQASASDQNLNALKKVQAYLDSQTALRTKTSQVVADSTKYQYQDEIIRDISSYAKLSSISINSFTFTDATAATGSATATPAAGTTPATPAPAGLTATKVTVAIKSPVDYNRLLDFIYRIEKNVTKMQIDSISLSRSVDEKGVTELTSESFNIGVYIRK